MPRRQFYREWFPESEGGLVQKVQDKALCGRAAPGSCPSASTCSPVTDLAVPEKILPLR